MFDRRIKELKQKLLEEKLDGVLISSVSNITYFSGFSNFSKDEREAYIFFGKDFEYIITDGRYSEAVKREVPHLELFIRGSGKSTEDLFKKHKIKSLGIEENNLTVEEYKSLKKYFKQIKDFPISRDIKTKMEIEKVEAACKLGDSAFEYAIGKLEKGITEKELAFEIEMYIKKNGAELSFPTIVAFDKNSSIPHHQTGNTKLENNQFVLIDMGVKLNGYCSDMTRTLFLGEPTEKQKEIHQIVLEAQQKAAEAVKDGVNKFAAGAVKAEKIDKIGRDYIISKGYPSIPHSVGHGVGLEVHEDPHLSPKSPHILKEGMVFSIEPGIYIEGFGGVRIEDLFVIEKNGVRQITNSSKKLTTS